MMKIEYLLAVLVLALPAFAQPMVKLLAALLLLGGLAFAQTPTTANLWVDTNGGTCTRQSSPGAWIDAQGCSSMQAAQTAAQGGDTVIIKNGAYGGQTISSSAKSTAVSYYAETPGSVLLTGDLSVSISHVHVTGVISTGTHNTRNSLHLTGGSSIVDLFVDGFLGQNLYVQASNVTVVNSDFGDGDACLFSTDVEDATKVVGPASNFVFKYNNVHDWTSSVDACNGMHIDGFQTFNGLTNATFDGNKFWNNATSNILTEQIAGNWIIQNNYFGALQRSGNNIVIGRGDCSGVIVQNNDIVYTNFNNTGDPTTGCTGSGGIYRNNIMLLAVSQCNTGAGPAPTYDHNIFVPSGGITCGTSTKRCTPNFLNGTPSSGNGFDVRLNSADTCAKDAGNPSGFSSTDILGTARPQGSAPDAGAFEIVSAASAPNPPISVAVTVH